MNNRNNAKISQIECFIILLLCLLFTNCASLEFNSSKKIEAEVCAHKHCKDASVNFNTDKIFPKTFEPFEAAFMLYNLGYTAFVSKITNAKKISDGEKKEIHLTRRGSIELYFRTDYWFNPKNKKIEIIPDYYKNHWKKDISKTFNTDLEGSKKSRFPNHGQELFDVSNGLYGFDTISNSPGTNLLNEFLYYFNSEKEYLEKIRNNEKITTLSYGNGQTGCAPILKNLNLIHSGRSSDYEKKDVHKTISYYGVLNGETLGNKPNLQFNESNFNFSRSNTTRVLSPAIVNRKIVKLKLQSSIDFSIKALELSLTKKGFYSSFAHWNYFYGPTSPYTKKDFRNDYIEFIKKTREKITELNLSVYSDSYEQIINYYESRNRVSSANAIVRKGTFTLKINHVDHPKELILNNSPLSIKLNLNDTKLSGHDIGTDNKMVSGIQKLTNNEFVINLNLTNQNNNTTEIEFYKTNNPKYLDFGIPKILKQVIDSTNIHISTDQETNIVLYLKEAEDLSSLRVLKRSNTNQNIHNIDLKNNKLKLSLDDIKSKEIYAGLLNPITKQSTLTKLTISDLDNK